MLVEESIDIVNEYINECKLKPYKGGYRYTKALKIHAAQEIILELMDHPFEEPTDVIFKYGIKMGYIAMVYSQKKDKHSMWMFRIAQSATDDLCKKFAIYQMREWR